MKQRRWDSKTKTKILLEGQSGRPVSEICNEQELPTFITRILHSGSGGRGILQESHFTFKRRLTEGEQYS
ncbi:MAG: hypothetical protein ACHQ6U_07860 [Thermodesulfobacteriota bacterium]